MTEDQAYELVGKMLSAWPTTKLTETAVNEWVDMFRGFAVTDGHDAYLQLRDHSERFPAMATFRGQVIRNAGRRNEEEQRRNPPPRHDVPSFASGLEIARLAYERECERAGRDPRRHFDLPVDDDERTIAAREVRDRMLGERA